MRAVDVFIWLVLFVIAFASLHLGLDLVVWLSAVIAAIIAFAGCLFVVVVLDGDGGPW